MRAAILMLLVAAPAFAQTPMFSAAIDVVRIDALVTDGRGIARGLTADAFEVLDNGVVQSIDLASFESLPIDVVMAFDLSDSVAGERLEDLRGAGRELLAGLRSGDRAGLLTFSHKLTLRHGLTREVAALRQALGDAEPQPQGHTALIDGAYAALLQAERDAGRGLLIVFSDGLDTASWLTPERVIDTARRANVTVYGVSVRDNGRSEFLEKMAEATGGGVIEIESTRDLSRAFAGILDEFRQRYVLSFSPHGVGKGGWHTLQVRIKGRRATVKARAGYFGG